MTRQIADIRNLDPATARMLREVESGTEDDLKAIGAVETYARLNGRNVSLLALYAMEAALLGIDWREVTPQIKAELQHRIETRG